MSTYFPDLDWRRLMARLWLEQACQVFGVIVLLASAAPLWADDDDAGEQVASNRQDSKLQVGNNRVTVVLDEENGAWDANWHGDADAVVRRAGFTVVVAGQRLTPQGVQAEAVPLDDAHRPRHGSAPTMG